MGILLLKIFTFHNVSINSSSVMIPRSSAIIFTFHNVSINSEAAEIVKALQKSFTFHNVSINSLFQATSHHAGDIYIP